MPDYGFTLASSAYVRLSPSPSRAYARGVPAQQTEWAAEMARALPDDGQRAEALDGVLFVSPAPSLSHQDVLGGLFVLISSYVRQHALAGHSYLPLTSSSQPTRLGVSRPGR
jgi:hypothetical protein